MKEATCELCGRKLRPAPARRDGEITYVGFMPCLCNYTFRPDEGRVEPGTPEHDAILRQYDKGGKR